MTQREVCALTQLSTSQLSAYENGRQLPGLETIARLAVALGTSIDRLYFGTPNEQFLNKATDLGETIVNCFRKLWELGVIGKAVSIQHDRFDIPFQVEGIFIPLYSYEREIARLINALMDFQDHKDTYSDGEAYLRQVCKSVANEMNKSPIEYPFQ